MLRRKEKKKSQPVRDPAADAQAKTGVPFTVRRVWNVWEPYMSFCTTGEFADAEKKGYRRHCGPTAVTNVILTLAAAGMGESSQVKSAPEVFTTVAGIGRRHGIYWNMDLLRHFGGTQDLRCGEYLRASLHHYGMRAGVIFHQPLGAADFYSAIRRGSLLYLELRHHPVYGDHHLVCSGMAEVVSTAEKRKLLRKRYLIVADGWSRAPAFLDLSEIGFCHFFEIRVPGRTV